MSTAGICIIVLDHRHDQYLRDLLDGIRLHCPDVSVALYNSGGKPPGPAFGDLPILPHCSRLHYAKVTPFFLDLLEWMVDRNFEYVINAETDMAFIRPGFEEFVYRTMKDSDYLAPGFVRTTPRTSRWRPYRSLRAELPELLSIIGTAQTNRCFSPGQIFSSRYASAVVGSPWYSDLRDFVTRNQEAGKSFSLQEVLLPTLADALRLRVANYPGHLASVNRYRPYHAASGVFRCRNIPDAYFMHPIRRDDQDPARLIVRDGLGRTT
ncbi:MAG: hypothetical protein H7Y15_11565 [Pseudonocardia sp.]|nr:hypothetical protein [Pseudonocardia sp.]